MILSQVSSFFEDTIELDQALSVLLSGSGDQVTKKLFEVGCERTTQTIGNFAEFESAYIQSDGIRYVDSEESIDTPVYVDGECVGFVRSGELGTRKYVMVCVYNETDSVPLIVAYQSKP